MVERLDEHEFRVTGRDVERVVALNDVSTHDAVAYISHRLERLGVDKLLARAGAADGDVIWIGDFSFEYKVVRTHAPTCPAGQRASACIPRFERSRRRGAQRRVADAPGCVAGERDDDRHRQGGDVVAHR